MSDEYWEWASDPDGPGIDPDPTSTPGRQLPWYRWTDLPHWVTVSDDNYEDPDVPRHDLDGFSGLCTEIDLEQGVGLVDLDPDFKGSEDDWWETSSLPRVNLVPLYLLEPCAENERPEPDWDPADDDGSDLEPY